MRQSSINVRAVVVYGLVGVVILALIVFGISWAKNRSQQYANQTQQSGQNQPQGAGDQNQNDQNNSGNNNPADQNANNPSSGDKEVASGQVSGAAATGPTTVPAAGASDWPMFLGATSMAAFMGAKFVQSRRRLASLR